MSFAKTDNLHDAVGHIAAIRLQADVLQLELAAEVAPDTLAKGLADIILLAEQAHALLHAEMTAAATEKPRIPDDSE